MKNIIINIALLVFSVIALLLFFDSVGSKKYFFLLNVIWALHMFYIRVKNYANIYEEDGSLSLILLDIVAIYAPLIGGVFLFLLDEKSILLFFILMILVCMNLVLKTTFEAYRKKQGL